MSKVVILGIFVADATYRTDRLPRIGETLLGNSFALGPGGKGSNQAVAAGRAGAETVLLTRIGQDPFGDMALSVWAEAGVTAPAPRVADPTGSACILVEEGTGDNAIIVAPGAANGITAAWVEGHRAQIENAAIFVTQLEQPMDAALAALRIAARAGVPTLLNPAPAAPLSPEMLALCDYITPNETEAEALTGLPVTTQDEARAAGARLLEMGVKQAALLTLGARGALYVPRDGAACLVPALQVDKVVETTGAGDAFNGAFAAALAEGHPPTKAVRFGCVAASISVTRPGAAASSPSRAEILAHL